MPFVRLVARVACALLALALLLMVVTLVAAWLVPLPGGPGVDAATLAAPGTRFIEVPAQTGSATGASAGTIRTAVVEMGPAGGLPVVLIHGFGGSTFSWRSVMAPLASAGYRVVALDLADFGLADKRWDIDTSHAAQARLVADVMDALGIERAVVVGHSMGGNIAAHLALAEPQRVAGLVLMDAAIVPVGTAPTIASQALGGALGLPPVRQLARQVVRRAMDDARFRQILTSAYGDPAFVTDAVFDGYVSAIRTPDWDLGLLAILRDSGRNALPRPLRELAMPTIVVWGERDPWIRLERGHALEATIPGSRLVVVPGSGHLPAEEEPAVVLEALEAFLARAAR